jgi:zinc transporter 1/2/3
MFSNECLGELPYEGTTAAIFMAGLFLSFLIDYISKRFLLWRQGKRTGLDAEATTLPSDAKTASPANSAVIPSDRHAEHVDLHSDVDAKTNVLVLEAGIIFHSLRTSPQHSTYIFATNVSK